MEIIVSAVLTAIIYGIQLFFGMKNLRKHIIKCDEEDSTILAQKDARIKKEQTGFKAIQYPGYLIRYTMGGFVITFHILIFVSFIPRLIWIYSYAFKWILEFLLPILILYTLQLLVARWSAQLIDSGNTSVRHSQQRTNLKNNLKNNIKHILQYFILVASKTYLLSNIICEIQKLHFRF
jgi:hypothetical protein